MFIQINNKSIKLLLVFLLNKDEKSKTKFLKLTNVDK